MFLNIILLFLLAGIPYYIYFQKTKQLSHEGIFLLTFFLFLSGIILAYFFPHERSDTLIVVALLGSLYAIYKAVKTTNLYKFSYYMFFINAPLLMMFNLKQTLLYSISLLVTLIGIYCIAKHYERSYGSANYHSITGTTLATPNAGLFLSIYLITLALYPPFPNAILFFNNILLSDVNLLWFAVITTVFFGNFFLAMRVMATTVFGKKNPIIHYLDLRSKDKLIHYLIISILFLLSLLGFKEILT